MGKPTVFRPVANPAPMLGLYREEAERLAYLVRDLVTLDDAEREQWWLAPQESTDGYPQWGREPEIVRELDASSRRLARSHDAPRQSSAHTGLP